MTWERRPRYQFPKDPKKIKKRIRRYERELRQEYEIWHSSNWERPEYLQYAPPEVWQLWDEPALQWARELYTSPEFSQVRARYINIYRELQEEQPGPRRSQLAREAFELRGIKIDEE